MKRLFRTCLGFIALVSWSVCPIVMADYHVITRDSVNSSEIQANAASGTLTTSEDGRYVAFESSATNLVSQDTNNLTDIFVRDRNAGTTERVSVSSTNVQANGASFSPRISADGRYVVFSSNATNLVDDDENGFTDVFLYDRTLDSISRISVDDADNEADGISVSPTISDDGTVIAFLSSATNLVAGDTNALVDVFVRDISTLGSETTTRVSVSATAVQSDGASGNALISGDGAYVVYTSLATNLVSNDTNGFADIFRYKISDGSVTRISVSTTSVQSNNDSAFPTVSDDGRYIAFESAATNLVTNDTNDFLDIFIRDVTGATTERVSVSSAEVQADGNSFNPSMSADGAFVGFDSDATNLVAGDTGGNADVFVRNISAGTTARVSIRSNGTQSNGDGVLPILSGTGRYIAYLSSASNLVTNDSNDLIDVFTVDGDCVLGFNSGDDFDSDGTANCDEDCGTDPLKTAAGICGCGTADTDGDTDGTADCIDVCASDATKILAGACGCGVAETDVNGNGVPDCIDPTNATVPKKPAVTVANDNAKVVMPFQFAGVTYQVRLLEDGKIITTKKKASNAITFKNLDSGSYKIRYRLLIPGFVQTKFSPAKAFVVK
jgi:Tol biopolymer transport system component